MNLLGSTIRREHDIREFRRSQRENLMERKLRSPGSAISRKRSRRYQAARTVQGSESLPMVSNETSHRFERDPRSGYSLGNRFFS